jgi:hypothetical protein
MRPTIGPANAQDDAMKEHGGEAGRELDGIARSALAIPRIASAALFVRRAGSGELRLAGAAGVEGEPLIRLSAAVLDPMHPIARTLADETEAFDVRPMAPGGPARRSHLPIRATGDGSCIGVLAVAHDEALDLDDRAALRDLAAAAGQAFAATRTA